MHPPVWQRNLYRINHLNRLSLCLAPSQSLVTSQRLGNLLTYRVDRIQGCHGLLKDHRNFVSPDLSQPGICHLNQVFALQND